MILKRKLNITKRQSSKNEAKLEEYFNDVTDEPLESDEIKRLTEQTDFIKLQIDDSLKKLSSSRGRNSDNRRNSPSIK